MFTFLSFVLFIVVLALDLTGFSDVENTKTRSLFSSNTGNNIGLEEIFVGLVVFAFGVAYSYGAPGKLASPEIAAKNVNASFPAPVELSNMSFNKDGCFQVLTTPEAVESVNTVVSVAATGVDQMFMASVVLAFGGEIVHYLFSTGVPPHTHPGTFYGTGAFLIVSAVSCAGVAAAVPVGGAIYGLFTGGIVG